MKVFDNTTVFSTTILTAGQFIETKWYAAFNDGGGARYIVMTPTEFIGIPDEVNDFTLGNGNIAAKQYAVGNGGDYVRRDGSVMTGNLENQATIKATNDASGTVNVSIESELKAADDNVFEVTRGGVVVASIRADGEAVEDKNLLTKELIESSRIWIQYNGELGIVDKSSGMAGAVDNGTGDYTFNYAADMSSVNHQRLAMAGTSRRLFASVEGSLSISYTRVQVSYSRDNPESADGRVWFEAKDD